MNRTRLLVLIFLVLAVILGFLFFRPKAQLEVHLLDPEPHAVLGKPFTTNVYHVGDAQPEGYRVFLNGQVFTPALDFFMHRQAMGSFTVGSAIGLSVDPGDLPQGYYDLQVAAWIGSTEYLSDTVRVYYLPEVKASKTATAAEIDSIRSFFRHPFNRFVIASYNSLGEKIRNGKRSMEYRASWEGVLAADIPKELKDPIRMYIDKSQQFIDDETDTLDPQLVNVPIDLLNHALERAGLPFYAYQHLRHFPLVNEITDTVHVAIDEASYPVRVARQVSMIAGGWTPRTVYGHSRTGYAVVHSELNEEKMAALWGCIEGRDGACGEYLNYAIEQLGEDQRELIVDQVRDEFRAHMAGSGQPPSAAALKQLMIESTAIHEAVHLRERHLGRKVGTTVVDLVDSLKIRPRRAEDPAHVMAAAKRISVNLEGQSTEYNAYLTELLFAPGLRRHLLTHIYGRARRDYEHRLILLNLATTAQRWPDKRLLKGSFDDHEREWNRILEALLEMPIQELIATAEAVYLADFGSVPKISVRH